MKLSDLKYALAYVFPLSAIIGMQLGSYYYWLTPFIAFGFLPALESILKPNKANYSAEETSSRLSNKIFDILLYLNLPLIFLVAFLGYSEIASEQLSWFEAFGLCFSVGIVLSSNGINVAHEIGHRKEKFNTYISQLMLLPSCYMHFNIEHNFGHHKNIGTREDPATSRYGESVYSFLPRTMLGSFKSAWKIESKFLHKASKATWSFSNRILQFFAIQLLYVIAIYFVLGMKAAVFALIAGFISASLLEVINYIEHYGLERKKLPNGKYEPVKNFHSWNSDQVLGRIMLFELTRHSDHHAKSTIKYQVLKSYDDVPELPLGYPASMLMAMVPPLWFNTMHKSLEKYKM